MMNSFSNFSLLGWMLPLVVLDLILKGVALYRSARAGQKVWFVVLLLVNSLGLLPLIYLLIHHQKTPAKSKR